MTQGHLLLKFLIHITTNPLFIIETMKVSVLSIASVGVIVALHAAPANAQQVRRKLTRDAYGGATFFESQGPPAATKSAKRGTSSPTSDTLASAKSAKAAALFAKSAKASISTSSLTSFDEQFD